MFQQIVSRVKACIKVAENELNLYDHNYIKDMTTIRTDLSKSVYELCDAISRRLEKVSPKIGFLNNWLKTSKHAHIEKEFMLIYNALTVLFAGMTKSAYLYACVNNDAGYSNFISDINKVKDEIDFNKIYNCCRLVSYEKVRLIENKIKETPNQLDYFSNLQNMKPVIFLDGETIKNHLIEMEN